MKIDMVSIMEWKGYSTLGNRTLCISVAISKLFLKLSKMLAKRYPESIKLRAISLKRHHEENTYEIFMPASVSSCILHHIEAIDHVTVR